MQRQPPSCVHECMLTAHAHAMSPGQLPLQQRSCHVSSGAPGMCTYHDTSCPMRPCARADSMFALGSIMLKRLGQQGSPTSASAAAPKKGWFGRGGGSSSPGVSEKQALGLMQEAVGLLEDAGGCGLLLGVAVAQRVC